MKSSAFALLILLMVGCSVRIPHSIVVQYEQHAIKNDKTKLLVKRFVEYWDARIKGDAKQSWAYELPYQKYLTSFKKYKTLLSGYQNTKIRLKNIHLLNPNEAVIDRQVIFKDGKVIDKKDRWFFVKDTWYHKFYQSVLPPKTIEEAEFQ